MEYIIGVGLVFLILFIAVRWLVKHGEQDGRNETVLEMKSKNDELQRQTAAQNKKTEEHHEKVRSDLPDSWDGVDRLRREEGPIDIRSGSSARLRKGR